MNSSIVSVAFCAVVTWASARAGGSVEPFGVRPGAESVLISQAARREVRAIQGDLNSPYEDKRRRAVAKLAAVGGADAFELVLGALGDEGAEPADEAQLVLPGFEVSLGTSRVLKAMLGREGLRSKDALVRLRAAEALGRLKGPVPGKAIIRFIDRRDEEVARAILWSLERLAEASRLDGDAAECLGSLEGYLGRNVPDGVRAAALQAMVRIDAKVLVEQRAALAKISGGESKVSLLQAQVLVGLEAAETEPARGEVRAALEHREASVRAAAIRLVGRMEPHREDVAALANRLEVEPRAALRAQTVMTLQRLTGKKHRAHAAAWTHSVNALPEDWVGRWMATAEEAATGGGEAVSAASLERLDPASDRLAVLVDFSGSLWNEREDGSCRKDLLDPEMDRLLDRITPGSRFYLIPFTGQPHPYSDASVKATSRELKSAKRFFRKATMRGQGNLFDAVGVALGDPDVDRVLILTDGAPTGGDRWNVDLMGDLLLEATRFRPVIFDFVLLDAPRRLQRSWASVAERSGGRTLSLSM
ncbi:MAG: hypothetical protein ACJAZN_001678 [Planctomycetota bacterium]|jgi:hypothetical protein